MDSPVFATREIIDTERSAVELFARVFRALSDGETFAVQTRVKDGDGYQLQVYFYSGEVGHSGGR